MTGIVWDLLAAYGLFCLVVGAAFYVTTKIEDEDQE